MRKFKIMGSYQGKVNLIKLVENDQQAYDLMDSFINKNWVVWAEPVYENPKKKMQKRSQSNSNL